MTLDQVAKPNPRVLVGCGSGFGSLFLERSDPDPYLDYLDLTLKSNLPRIELFIQAFLIKVIVYKIVFYYKIKHRIL